MLNQMNFVKINRLKGIVNNVFKTNVDKKSRESLIIEARATCYKIMRDEMRMSLAEIGGYFLKSHATVLHGVKEYPYMLKFKPDLVLKYKACINLWRENEASFNIEKEIVDILLIKKSVTDLQKSNCLLSLAVTQLKDEVIKLKKLQ